MDRRKCFRLAFAISQAQLFSCQCLLFTNEKKMHYCGPDGNIPHDQTNQSLWWDAGVTQPCSNTPFHSLSGTNTWSPINGTLRTHEEGCFSVASVVQSWWLHNHTAILSEEKGDELPNKMPQHASTNSIKDAALAGTLTCSLASHVHMWAHRHQALSGQDCWNKSRFNKLQKCLPVGFYRIKTVCNIKEWVNVWY